MRRLAILHLFFCTALFPQSAIVDSAGIKKAILAVIDRQVAGWNNGSVDKFMEGYARSDSLRFASGGTVTYGWKEMLERYKSRYSSREMMGRLVFSDISISVISNDAALAFGKWELKRNADSPHGLFTLLFRRLDGRWVIVHDHTSSSE